MISGLLGRLVGMLGQLLGGLFGTEDPADDRINSGEENGNGDDSMD